MCPLLLYKWFEKVEHGGRFVLVCFYLLFVFVYRLCTFCSCSLVLKSCSVIVRIITEIHAVRLVYMDVGACLIQLLLWTTV